MSSIFNISELQFIEAPSVFYEHVQALQKFFSQAKKSIKVFSGEAHWMLYSHSSVLDTLRDQNNRGVDIKFIAGPALSVSKRGKETYLGILELAKEKVINLYSRETRGKSCHFIIIDDAEASIEDHHPPLLPLDERIKTKAIAGSERFNEVCKIFSDHLARLKPSNNPNEDFALMTPSQINELVRSGVNFDGLTKEALLKNLTE
jgi:hypothetical protein